MRRSTTTTGASLEAQMVKSLPAMWETWVRFPGWKDSLVKEMATHYSTLAWKIPWMEETGRLQSVGLQRVRHDWTTSLVHKNCAVQQIRKIFVKAYFKKYAIFKSWFYILALNCLSSTFGDLKTYGLLNLEERS